jgi:hypothetical protein
VTHSLLTSLNSLDLSPPVQDPDRTFEGFNLKWVSPATRQAARGCIVAAAVSLRVLGRQPLSQYPAEPIAGIASLARADGARGRTQGLRCAQLNMSQLKPFQVINHFKEARHITTKSGLLRTLRMLPWYAPESSDGYGPIPSSSRRAAWVSSTVGSLSAPQPHSPREDGRTNRADASRINLASAWVCFPTPKCSGA